MSYGLKKVTICATCLCLTFSMACWWQHTHRKNEHFHSTGSPSSLAGHLHALIQACLFLIGNSPYLPLKGSCDWSLIFIDDPLLVNYLSLHVPVLGENRNFSTKTLSQTVQLIQHSLMYSAKNILAILQLLLLSNVSLQQSPHHSFLSPWLKMERICSACKTEAPCLTWTPMSAID